MGTRAVEKSAKGDTYVLMPWELRDWSLITRRERLQNRKIGGPKLCAPSCHLRQGITLFMITLQGNFFSLLAAFYHG